MDKPSAADAADRRSSVRAFRDSRGGNAVLWAAKAFLLGAVLVFVGRYVVANWQQVRDVPAPRMGPLVWATVWGVLSSIGMAWIVGLVLAAHGSHVSLGKAVGLRFLPPLGKYLPGKFWSLIASLWLFARVGVPKHVAVTSIGLNMILGLLSQCLVILAMQAKSAQHPAVTGTMIALSTAMILGLHPRVFYPCVNWVFRRTGQPPLETKLSFPALAGLVVVTSITWVFYGFALYNVLLSVAPLSLQAAPECIAAFLFAQVVGFIALFAPAGIGVREGVLLVALRPLVGEGPAIVVAGLARLWQTALELVLAAVGWWLLRPSVPSDSKELESL
jgi:glycosyltransferase 2 family protein